MSRAILTRPAWLVIWLPRHPIATAAACAAAAIVLFLAPGLPPGTGPANRLTVPLQPLELVPLGLIVVLAVLLRPRLPQWELVGLTDVRCVSCCCALVAAALPAALALVTATLSPAWPPSGIEPGSELVIATNLLTAGLLLTSLLPLLGALAAPLSWSLVMLASHAAARNETLAALAPVASPSAIPRGPWPAAAWLAVGLTATVALAWRRRGVAPTAARTSAQ